MIGVWICAHTHDILLYLGDLLKGIKYIGCDEEANKYGDDGGMTFDLVFGKFCHHLMTLKGGPHHSGSLIHSLCKQKLLDYYQTKIQVIYYLPNMVRKKEIFFYDKPWQDRIMIYSSAWVRSTIMNS